MFHILKRKYQYSSIVQRNRSTSSNISMNTITTIDISDGAINNNYDDDDDKIRNIYTVT